VTERQDESFGGLDRSFLKNLITMLQSKSFAFLQELRNHWFTNISMRLERIENLNNAHMEFDFTKRIFIFDDHEGTFRIEKQTIYSASDTEILRLVCFDVSELLRGKHLYLNPSLFRDAFQILREALPERHSKEMIQLLGRFAGLRKNAKRIVVWEAIHLPEPVNELFPYVGKMHRRKRALHLFRSKSKRLKRILEVGGFRNIGGSDIWIGGGLGGRIRNKLWISYKNVP